jgi:putative transposase
VWRLKVPQLSGRAEPARSQLWSGLANTREVLKTLIVEMDAGGLSQRAIEYSLEKARGQFVLSKRTGGELTNSLTQEYEAFRTRDLSGYEVAYRFLEAVYEPLRRWGSKRGVLGVGAICVDGRKVLLSLSTATRASDASGLEVRRDWVKRGLQTPVTIPTEGAVGLTKASDGRGPKSLRIRCWVPKMQTLQQKVPPPVWPEVTALGIARRDAPSGAEAERRRQELVKRSQLDFPEACRGLLDDAQASLNHLAVPPRHQQSVRTANLAERAFEEERRRTKVIPQLWDEGSVVKLVFAVLIRVSDRWGKKALSEFEQQQIRNLRQKLHLDEQEVPSLAPTPETQTRRSAASAA